jgi:hypothetical protein
MSSHGIKANVQYMSMRDSRTSPFNYIMKESDMRVSIPFDYSFCIVSIEI